MFSRLSKLGQLFSSATKKIQIFINDDSYLVDSNLSIYQAAKENNIQIPRFCYHERLKVAGNCRMCLVQVEKSPKPVPSCCSQVAPAMRIQTKSLYARNAQGAVMEFLLANHPLDCPICDQAGECDLQNHSYFYGYTTSRYNQFKRAVEDKNIGPLVITHMNRCIHCTRCIRFAEQIAGFHDLGTSGRGRGTEIGTYVEKMLESELSGNLADVCPVGALNNGPFAYTSRPFQLLSKPSIDVMDSLGSNVELDHRENNILRIKPRVHEQINQEWLSDKSRQAFDGLKRQRLRVPLLRRGKDFVEYAWEDALSIAAQRINGVEGQDIACGIGEFESIESLQAMKDFLNRLNCFNYEFRKEGNPKMENSFRSDYLFNTSIEKLQNSDFLLLVGVNPRLQAPVLNSRILKTTTKNNTKIYNIGSAMDLTYEYEHLGVSPLLLEDIRVGTHPIVRILQKSKLPAMILGSDIYNRDDSEAIINCIKDVAAKYNFVSIKTGWNGMNVLHRSQGNINALQLGISFEKVKKNPKVIILVGCDNQLSLEDIPKDSFVIYIGPHGDQGAQYADLILPVAAYTEQQGTFVNTEGRVQLANKVVEPPGHSRETWEVFRALAELCGIQMGYDSKEQLRYRIFEAAPHLLKYDCIEETVYGKVSIKQKGEKMKINNIAFSDLIDNFYMTDAISRNSITMAKCSVAFNVKRFNNFKKIRQQF